MVHPNLLRILAWSRVPCRWACFEFFDANLYYFMQNTRPWKVESFLFTKILAPIANAVAFLHSRGYVHKNISPTHILFTNDFSRVVLAGHHLAKQVLWGDKVALSSAKRGEVLWVDPNSYNRTYCKENDTYSLGLVIGELLTGELPYGGAPPGTEMTRSMIHFNPCVFT